MDILTIIVTLLVIGLIASWIVLPGTSNVTVAEAEPEATVLIPAD